VAHLVAQRLFDLSGDLSGLADRDTEFRLPTGRGDEFAHGGGPDPRDAPKLVEILAASHCVGFQNNPLVGLRITEEIHPDRSLPNHEALPRPCRHPHFSRTLASS